jgi:hypothetical protein
VFYVQIGHLISVNRCCHVAEKEPDLFYNELVARITDPSDS